MPDYRDWTLGRGLVSPEAHAESQRRARLVAIRMEDLERGDEWAVFRAHVEALKAQAEAMVESIKTSMEDAVGTKHTRLRLHLREAQGAVIAYDQILNLPTTIKDQAQRD